MTADDSTHMNRGMNSKRKEHSRKKHSSFRTSQPASHFSHSKRKDTGLQIASFLVPSVLSPHSAPHCHSPSTVRAWLSHTVTVGFSAAATNYHTSCISWHNISRAVCQLKATLARSESRKREIFSPDHFCPITIRARAFQRCAHTVRRMTRPRSQYTTQRRCPSQGSHTSMCPSPIKGLAST